MKLNKTRTTVSSLGKESAVNSRLFDPATFTSEQSITRALHAGEDEAESSEMLHMSRVGSKLQKSVMSDRVRVQVEDVKTSVGSDQSQTFTPIN